MSWYLIKVDRLAAWTLLGSMLMYFISGYGMTKGLINYDLANNLHSYILPLVLIVSFSIHTCYAVSLTLRRWNAWNLFTKFFLFGLYACIFFGLLYANSLTRQRISSKVTTSNVDTSSSAESTNTNTETQKPSNTASVQNTPSATKTFSKSELAKYNGQNGQPAYVAINGNVYDLSVVFVDGFHRGHTAGTDLTIQFERQHDLSILSNFEVVGKYSG